MKKEAYLGDGAYVEWTGNEFIVYTSNGIERSNQVFLDSLAMKQLVEFYMSLAAWTKSLR
mgnify:CR=1 FL=1